MKNKRYRNGNSSFQCYLKLIGRSYECGVICAGKIIFLGNFTRKAEAMQWWGLMNREIRNFAKRYKVGKTYPAIERSEILPSATKSVRLIRLHGSENF